MGVRSAVRTCAVLSLTDLPRTDQTHLRAVAKRLGWAADLADDAWWQAPLVLAPARPQLKLAGLRSERELLGARDRGLILATRLVLADALDWPERAQLERDATAPLSDLTIYVGEASRWDKKTLAAALEKSGRWSVVKGLTRRPERTPRPACERVPVLGFEVPMFGAPLDAVRDVRPAEEVPHRVADVEIPLGMRPAHRQGRWALFVEVTRARVQGDAATAQASLWGVDPATGESFRGTLALRFRSLEPIYDAEQSPAQLGPGVLVAHLNELLPHCLLSAPDGGIAVLDLFGLGLHAVSLADSDPTQSIPKLRLSAERILIPLGPESDDEPDAAEVDPTLWPLDVLARLIDEEATEVAPDGGSVTYHLSGIHDGEPVSGRTCFALR